MNPWTEKGFTDTIKTVGRLVHEKGQKKSQQDLDELVDKLARNHGLVHNNTSPGYTLIHNSIVSIFLNYNRAESITDSTQRQIARAWSAVNTAQREGARNLQPQS